MISIIVPVYNVEKYLKRCIKSILEQSYTDFELILIDDGSTDTSGTICDDYKSDIRVHVVHKENEGVSVARNYGIEIAKGDYLWFVDSDDWIDTNALSILFKDNPSSDIIMFGAYSAMEVSGELILSKRVSWKNKTKPFDVKNKYREIFNKNVTLWNKIIKRTTIDSIRFDEYMTYGEDCDFLYKILQNTNSAIIFPYELYYYFINRAGSVVSAKIDNRSIELLDNTQKIYNSLSAINYGSSGIRRIVYVTTEVLSKIPLNIKEIRDNEYYIREARKLLFYPNFVDKFKFILDRSIELSVRIMYIRLLVNPFHMYFRMMKKIFKDFIKK